MKLIIAFSVYICSIFVLVRSAGSVKLPKGFLKCKQNDAEFQNCVTKGANLAIPELVREEFFNIEWVEAQTKNYLGENQRHLHLSQTTVTLLGKRFFKYLHASISRYRQSSDTNSYMLGQPKFAIPSIDPLKITNLYIDQGHGSVKIKLNFTNLEIYGLNSASVHDAHVDFAKSLIKLKLDLHGPMKLLGHYRVNGQVLVLPITGNGPCNLTLYDFKADSTSHFQPVEKNGEIHWHMKHMDFDFGISKLYIQLDNLFNGDKNLGPQMNIFLNENWEEIFNELRPAFRTALATVLTDIAQRFFDKVPVNAVFPKH